MKTISTALSNHLDQEVTTLATCWKIVRRDGATFLFTDHDQNLTVDGEEYEAESSYSRTAVASSSDFSVDNLDVAGVLNSDQLDEEEMRNGLFNRADVYVFIVNWANPEQGVLKMRRGWFGEVQLQDNGQFSVEIRGLAQALGHNYLEVYTPECRADFCDTRCKLNIADFENYGTVTGTGDGRVTFVASELPDAPTSGTSVGAHRTWAIKPTNFPMGTYFGIAAIRFWDQDGNEVKDGFVGDSLTLAKLRKGSQKKIPAQATDNKMQTTWWVDGEVVFGEDEEAIDIHDQIWYITFPQPTDIKQVEIIAPPNYLEAPTAFNLYYTDDIDLDDGYTLSLAMTCAYTFTSGGQSAVWGLGSGTDAPINIASGPTPLPSPYNSVSTYVGGTVEWATGRNRGRRVEIQGYNDASNTIEMFEPMFYPIQIGDTFKIAQGCDKSLARCKLYNNVINRRAEDYVPGNDEMMRYPDAHS